MKPKTDFDPMFQADLPRRRWPIRWIGASTIVLALSGLALRAGPIPPRRPVSPPSRLAPMPGGWVAVQGGASNPRVGEMQPRDRFVIVAPAEIDPGMVVRAREDIDPEMVFNPDTRRRGSAPIVPAPVIVAPVTAPAPAPDHAWPR
jgi:hypothetical protein